MRNTIHCSVSAAAILGQLAVVFAVMGCQGDRPDAFIETVQARVSRDMRDPSATQFRNMKRGSPGYACGEVNSKNAYGGYVGFVRFLADTSGDVVIESEKEPIDSVIWSAACDSSVAPTLETRKQIMRRYDSTVRAAALATLDSMQRSLEVLAAREEADQKALAVGTRARQLVEAGIHPFIGWRSRRVMYSYFCQWYSIPLREQELFETELEGGKRGYRMATDKECGI